MKHGNVAILIRRLSWQQQMTHNVQVITCCKAQAHRTFVHAIFVKNALNIRIFAELFQSGVLIIVQIAFC